MTESQTQLAQCGVPDTLTLQELDAKPASLVERAVLTSIADGVVVNDVAGSVTLINRAAAQLLAVDPQAATGRPARSLFQSFSTKGRLTIVDAMDRLYADPYSAEYSAGITETIIEVGLRVIQAHLSPVLTETGEFLGIVTVLRDITREVEAERAKTDFVSNVSHELRTPLTSIKGYSDLLLCDAVGALNSQQRHFVKIIQSSSDRLTSLINELLDISRIESGRLKLDTKPVQLEKVLHSVADMIQPQCDKKNLRLSLSIEPKVGLVLGDENRLTQVVTNLVSNACRYTPEGGSITLALSNSSNIVQVDVTDTGIGIASEDQAKVFQRFYRVNTPAVQEVAGTGLGLPISKMLVEMHGGRMWVESEMGKGSTFTFILPLYVGAPNEGVLEPEAKPRNTVLVVEDDRDIAELIALQLHLEGFEAITTARGDEAVSLALNQHIDLITLDMMLPDITGMEVLQRLKTDPRTAEIPVVIVSIVQPKSLGNEFDAADHISKPFALEKLMESVRNTLESSQRKRPLGAFVS
jgi:signal transduction histidine kinase/ActR/RegA family two-component response regulator